MEAFRSRRSQPQTITISAVVRSAIGPFEASLTMHQVCLRVRKLREMMQASGSFLITKQEQQDDVFVFSFLFQRTLARGPASLLNQVGAYLIK